MYCPYPCNVSVKFEITKIKPYGFYYIRKQSAMVRGWGRPNAGRSICAVDINLLSAWWSEREKNTQIMHNGKGNSYRDESAYTGPEVFFILYRQ